MARILIVEGAGHSRALIEQLKRAMLEEGICILEGDSVETQTVFGIKREEPLDINTRYVPEFPTFLTPKETRHKAQWKVENRGRKMK